MGDTTHDIFGPQVTVVGQNTESTGRAAPKALRCDADGRLYVNPMWGMGTTYYVQAGGSDSNDGKSYSQAFLTMAYALAAVTAGDTIKFFGTIAESSGEGDPILLDTDDVQIIGLGPVPGSNIIEDAADGALAALKVTGKRCRFENIRFRGAVSAGAAADAYNAVVLSGAHNAAFENCRFQGRANSSCGILTYGNSDNVQLINTDFLYFNTATYGYAIHGITYTADVIPSSWLIDRCRFMGNTNHLVCRAREWVIRDSIFQHAGLGPDGAEITTTTKIDLSGGANSKWNVLFGNCFGGTYSILGGYTGGTSDEWIGNYVAGGLTTANPG